MMSFTRGLTRIWKPRGQDSVAIENSNLITRILHARGLKDDHKARAFLNPTLNDLHDPSLMPGLEAAADRIMRAISADERIIIYGDYDVDGMTATTILVRLIRAIAPSANIGWYIPHRVDEGYGINSAALERLAGEDASVVVSVDCGITAIDPAIRARELGLDLIITDHHNPPHSESDMPDAFAVVHPRVPGSDYPFGELCGAGVAYKLAWRLATLHAGNERVGRDLRDVLLDLLALTALGSVADIVPLIDENRAIARFGLSRCRSSSIVGLRALVTASGLDNERIDAEAAGFQLGPRLNACGRLGHAHDAVEMLLTDDVSTADRIAQELSAMNDQRRRTERAIFDEACEMAEAAGMTGADRRAIVLSHESWHPGVVGIVCSRMVEKYARPTILMQRTQDSDGASICAGSGRSIDGFNLHAGLEACANLLIGYGGHDMAAGMRCRADDFELFADAFIAHTNGQLQPDDLVQTIHYDCLAAVNELTPKSINALEDLKPFGRANPSVRVRLDGMRIETPPETFGQRGDHLKLRVRPDAHGSGQSLLIVGWRWAARGDQLRAGTRLDLVVTPKISSYSGRVEPVLEDERLRDSTEVVVRPGAGVQSTGTLV